MPQDLQPDNETQVPLLADAAAPGTAYGAVDDAGHGVNPHQSEAGASGTFSKNLGTLNAFAIIISIVIGSGIFTSTGSVDANVPSPGVALIAWLVGGVLALAGATTLAELGTAIPGEGGVQPYLRYIYGDVFGYMAAWTWIVAVMPATLAILSIVFVESIFSAAGDASGAGSLQHKLLSVLVLVATSAANSISTEATTRLNNFFVATKFVSILGVVLTALVVVITQVTRPGSELGGGDWASRPWFGYRRSFSPGQGWIDWSTVSSWEMLGHFSAALYGALWAYSGWDKAIYISAELSAPARQLPLAINTAIPAVILCFVTANVAYYILLPWDLVSMTDSVAVDGLRRVGGPALGIIAVIFICLVVAGSLLGNSFVAGRMVVAAAQTGWFPNIFSQLGVVGFRTLSPNQSPASTSSASDAPINALILSSCISTLYILLGDFRTLLTFNGLGEYSFFFLTVLGAIILRRTEPDLHRPYRPWILAPVIFLAVSGFVVIRGAIFAPLQSATLLGVWLLGLGFYWLGKRQTAETTS